MAVSTKVFLTGVVLVILSLAAYYGILGPTDDPLLEATDIPREPEGDSNEIQPADSSGGGGSGYEIANEVDSGSGSPGRVVASDTPIYNDPDDHLDRPAEHGGTPDGMRFDQAQRSAFLNEPEKGGGSGAGGEASGGRRDDPKPEIPTTSVNTSPVRANAGSYTIKRGDTLWSIAEDRYGDGSKWTLIVDANPSLAGGVLREGERIKTPSVETNASVRGGASANSPPVRLHVIASGESLSTIAQRYYRAASKWQKIFDANRDVIGDNPNRLKVGMKLTIPPLG